MASCKVCSKQVVNDKVECDGICGQFFHASCLKRSSRISPAGFTTCNECSDIKPCHILRLVKSIIEPLSIEQSFIADKVNLIASNCAGLQLFSDDFGSFGGKLDKLMDATALFNSNSSTLLAKLHDAHSKLINISASVEDLRASFSGCDFSSAVAGNGATHILPAIEDIRRGVKQINSDFGSWSEVVSKSSSDITAVASDMKGLLLQHRSRDPVSTVSPDLTDPASVNLSSSRRRRRRRAALPVESMQPRSIVHLPSRGLSTDAPLPSNLTACANGSDSLASELNISDHPSSQRSNDMDTAPGDPVDSSAMLRSSGTIDAVALRPAVLPRCVFVSRIHPDTTVDDVICHISSHFGVSQSSVSCKRIDKPRNNIVSFSASFKIVIPDALFNAIISPEIWPSGTIVREFIPRHRPVNALAPKNLSGKSPSTTQM